MAGAWTTPSCGRPFSISAMLTVNSPCRLMNSLVPSSGSTSQNGPALICVIAPSAISSSATIGNASVTSRRIASRIRTSARRSASVTGEVSSLRSTAKSRIVDGEDGLASAERDVADALDHVGTDVQAQRIYSCARQVGGGNSAADCPGGRREVNMRSIEPPQDRRCGHERWQLSSRGCPTAAFRSRCFRSRTAKP